MIRLIHFTLTLVTTSVRSRLSLQAENAVLRNQLSLYRKSGQRPRIKPADRLLWCFIAKFWADWRTTLYFVQPRTVITWQKKRFRDYWRALSQSAKPGRPQISRELRKLIERMWEANPTWGSPKIVAELAMLGIDVAKSTVDIDEVITAPASPWQNAYAERVIGTLRRELFDHVIVFNERHLKRLMSSYLDYYHPWRTHQSLDRDAPDGRPVRAAEPCNVVELPAVHGLHHVYLPKAA